MDFALTAEQTAFQESVRRFAERHLAEGAVARAHDESFPWDVARLMAANGLFGIMLAGEDGGQGGALMDAVIAAEIRKIAAEVEAASRALPPHDEFVARYCPADRFQPFVEAEFGGTTGGARVLAIRDWIAANLSYVPGCSDSNTTALDSFVERRGICRDFAHVMITLARASAIPARYCSAYAPGVEPPDFHAVAELFLADPTTPGGGAWYIVDATQMADPAETVKIGVGRPARGDTAARHVLGAFDPADLATIDTACAEAASRAVDLAAPAARGRRAISTPAPEASSRSPRG